MKTTVSINIGGLAFYIDEDAYAALKKYLRKVELHYAKEEGNEEIIADIEARVAELFREKINDYKQVITVADVYDVISVLGDPEDFEESHTDERTQMSYVSSGRRLYRDIDNRIIGGVCSGLAAYFNIDVIVIRVLFVVFAFVGGVALIVYPILWIVMPAALTRAQKIEMRGEAVNIENIKRTVRDEFDRVRDSFKKR